MAKRRGNGTNAEWYDEKKKIWRGSISLGRDENGRIKRKSVSGKTQTEVRQKLKQIELKVFTGDYVDETTITIRELAEQIEKDKLELNEIGENTYFRNIETIKMLNEISYIPIQQITEARLKSFIASKLDDYSQTTINKMYVILRRTFREAVKRKIRSDNPMEDIKKPKSKKQTEVIRALTVQEQSRLMEVLQTGKIKYSQQMILSMFTGMRMGEINALTVKDINLIFNTISVNKSMSRGRRGEAILGSTTKTEAGDRILPITSEIKPLLSECVKYAENGLLFYNRNGKMLTTNQVNAELQRALKKYDIADKDVRGKITLHSLRHTYATRCIEGGMNAKALQKLMGHKDISMTLNRYCDAFEHFESENIKRVNEYLKQNGLTLNSAIV